MTSRHHDNAAQYTSILLLKPQVSLTVTHGVSVVSVAGWAGRWYWYPVYTMQPVVKPVIQPVWQPAASCKQTSNRLSKRAVKPGWQPCWTNSHRSFNRLSNRVVQPVWKPAVYTIQPVVKRVWQLVECLYTRYNRLSNSDNRVWHRLYRVNGAWRLAGWQAGRWRVTVGVVRQSGADAERYRWVCLHCTQGLAGRGDGLSVRPRLAAF